MGLDFVSLNFSVIFSNALPTPLLKNKSYFMAVESYFYFVGFEKGIYHFRVLCQPPDQSILYFFIQNTVFALPWWLISKEFSCQCRRREFSPWLGKIPHATGPLSSCATSTEPVPSSPGVTAAESRCHNYWSLSSLEPKPMLHNKGSHHSEKPAHCN